MNRPSICKTDRENLILETIQKRKTSGRSAVCRSNKLDMTHSHTLHIYLQAGKSTIIFCKLIMSMYMISSSSIQHQMAMTYVCKFSPRVYEPPG